MKVLSVQECLTIPLVWFITFGLLDVKDLNMINVSSLFFLECILFAQL